MEQLSVSQNVIPFTIKMLPLQNSSSTIFSSSAYPSLLNSQSQTKSELGVNSNKTICLIEQIICYLGQKQWQQASNKLSKLIHSEPQSVPQLEKLALALTTSWIENTSQIFLIQFLDCVIVSFMGVSNRKLYTELVYQIFVKSIICVSEFCSQNVQQNEDQQKGLAQIWQMVIQLLRSYNYACLKMGLHEDNWFISWTITNILLRQWKVDSTFEQQASPMHKSVLDELSKLNALKIPDSFHNQQFHTSMLLLRLFVSQINSFMSTNNKIIACSEKHPSINNCSLLMKIIQSQFLSFNFSKQVENEDNDSQKLEICNKLDCLILLITIMETSLPKCQNYNRVLEYSIYIVFLLEELEEERFVMMKEISKQTGQKIKQISPQDRIRQTNQKKYKQEQNISPILFYCGQLVSLIIYKNCDWVAQFCRKEAKSSQVSSHKSFKKLLKIYQRSVDAVMINIQQLQYDQIIYKRLVLGFCGLLRINKMETAIEQTIQKLSGPIIKIIQSQHGWHDEEEQAISNSVEYKQSSLNKSLQNLHWSEQYYNKHRVKQFQKTQQISELLKSMWELKDHNIQIFQHFMSHFDQKQSLLWMVELEKYGEQKDDLKEEDSDD